MESRFEVIAVVDVGAGVRNAFVRCSERDWHGILCVNTGRAVPGRRSCISIYRVADDVTASDSTWGEFIEVFDKFIVRINPGSTSSRARKGTPTTEDFGKDHIGIGC